MHCIKFESSYQRFRLTGVIWKFFEKDSFWKPSAITLSNFDSCCWVFHSVCKSSKDQRSAARCVLRPARDCDVTLVCKQVSCWKECKNVCIWKKYSFQAKFSSSRRRSIVTLSASNLRKSDVFWYKVSFAKWERRLRDMWKCPNGYEQGILFKSSPNLWR